MSSAYGPCEACGILLAPCGIHQGKGASGMSGHCCFAGCDLTTCRNCGESRCVRALHFCEAKCPECGHAMTYHAPSDEGCACGKCLWDEHEPTI